MPVQDKAESAGNQSRGSSQASSISAWIYNPQIRAFVFQALLLLFVGYLCYSFISNAYENMQRQNLAGGFNFLGFTSGFDINFTLIEYNETSTYGRVLLVGLLNTLLVAAIGIFFATIIGLIVGIARLSNNWGVQKLATAYVEVTRNLPLLFQILFWYMAVIRPLPAVKDSYKLFDLFYLNVRGAYIPRPVFSAGAEFVGIALVIAVVLAIIIGKWAHRRQMQTGQQFPVWTSSLGLIIGLPLIVLMLTGFPISFETPVQSGPFNLAGGIRMVPELVALILALSTYTAGFIAEIIRAGIVAVSHGQTEAAYSLGLRPSPTLRLIVIPQAMRVIIPPMTSQYLNLTKNSSLAVAIGYPDLVAVFAGTTLNQTGQAIEVIAITMGCYLVISLLTSGFMNWYNRRIALVER